MGRSSYAASVWCKGILRGYRPHCLPISFSKGHRSALPAASIMLKQPMSSYRGQASELEIHRQETRNTKAQMVEILARAINKTESEIEKDINRPKYFDAWGAKEYGIIDKVLEG
mmetsp:Transcript_7139/g.15986  ORF Transcript_7139/g.15986 Transcript_7139/m.15986 type:complete len:114 (-) Transcript_7139:52-393(-)